MKPPPPEAPAICWSLVGERWHRVARGTAAEMHELAGQRLAFALAINPEARFEVTVKGADGRCPEPGRP